MQSLKNWRTNNHADPVIVAACNARLVVLTIIYLGSFQDELVTYLSGLPDHKIHLILPLADAKGGKPRPSVCIEVGLNDVGRIYIRDVATGIFHSSLSAVRARYIKSGGGSESWTGFRDPGSRETIANIIGVDPALAHENRTSRTR